MYVEIEETEGVFLIKGFLHKETSMDMCYSLLLSI